jgi:hypothetical protein
MGDWPKFANKPPENERRTTVTSREPPLGQRLPPNTDDLLRALHPDLRHHELDRAAVVQVQLGDNGLGGVKNAWQLLCVYWVEEGDPLFDAQAAAGAQGYWLWRANHPAHNRTFPTSLEAVLGMAQYIVAKDTLERLEVAEWERMKLGMEEYGREPSRAGVGKKP